MLATKRHRVTALLVWYAGVTIRNRERFAGYYLGKEGFHSDLVTHVRHGGRERSRKGTVQT